MNTAKSQYVFPNIPRLRPALIERALSSAGKAEALALYGPRPTRFLAELLMTWLCIAGLIALGIYANHVAVTILCVVLIGTRQSVLALLLHEQVHRLGLRSKYGDWVVNFFAVFPLVVTTVEDYAKVHLSHHSYFFTSKDPDFIRKAGPEWTFPQTAYSIFKIVLRDVTAMNLVRLIKGKTAPRTDEFTRRYPTPRWLRIVFFGVLASLLTATGGWTIFLIYWILPLLTVAQLMIRWIAVAEHEYNIENGTVIETTPIIELTWWQKVLMPDLNFGYHAYHHLHPAVSFALLPQLHEIYRREGLVDDSAVFKGQGAYLRHLLAARPGG